MDTQKSKPKLIKILQVGDYQTGKTCLQVRYSEGKYGYNHFTIGIEFFMKNIKIEDQEVKFQFWDLHSGNERLRSIHPYYYKECSVLMISYDITNRQSFEKALFFFQDYNKCRGNNLTTQFLVGNKCDLEEQRQVSYQEGKQLSESLGMLFMEVSAKEDYQVKELFEKVMNNAFNIN